MEKRRFHITSQVTLGIPKEREHEDPKDADRMKLAWTEQRRKSSKNQEKETTSLYFLVWSIYAHKIEGGRTLG